MNSPDRLFDLGGRVVLVAGGGGYLGASICHGLAAYGARVIVADRDADAAASVRDAIIHGIPEASAEAMSLDVCDQDDIARKMEVLAQAHDGLDALVNAVAFSRGKTIDHITTDDWEVGIRVNLTGAFLLSRAAAEQMAMRGGGSIVHFASMYAMVSPDPQIYPDPTMVNPPEYGVGKAGLVQLTRYQAVMWAPRGVRVNAISPGPFPNPVVQERHPEMVRRLAERSPMGRIGHPHEIPGAVIFLVSDASTYVTGATLPVDGGYTAI